MGVKDADVLIVGAGPAGLMLAGELALAGADVAIVERRPSQALAGARAGGLHARTIEVLDQRGLAERFLAEGQPTQAVGLATIRLDIGDFPSRYPFTLGLWQNHIERLLAGWVGELKVPIHWGRTVEGLAQDGEAVTVELSGGQTMRARYLVGCDGGRSVVRKSAGIEFPGWDPTTSSLIAEVEMAEKPPIGVRRDAAGVHGLGRLDYVIKDGQIVFKDEGPIRVMLTEAEVGPAREPSFDELKQALVRVYGSDFGAHSPSFISRFTDMTRQAAAYRRGRVFLAGDAAHVHAPDGGQGLNTGVQDAVNLGWKLARVVKGTAPDGLLDTYHAERHPVGAWVLRISMAAVTLRRDDARTTALRETMAELLAMEAPRKAIAGKLSGLAIHYDLGAGHPLLGRRMPDLDLATEAGLVRVYSLLHTARPVLLDLDASGLEITPWNDRVDRIAARYDGAWSLPALGDVPAPAAVLIRPDGYVAWVGEGGDERLAEALTKWFGPAAIAG